MSTNFLTAQYSFLNIWLSYFNLDFFSKSDTFINVLDDNYMASLATSLFIEVDSTTTFSACWLVLFLWSISNKVHFFILLVLFEMTFASFCVDLISFSIQYSLLDGLVFSLIILVYAALESIVGLSFLVYINRTCQVSHINSSFI